VTSWIGMRLAGVAGIPMGSFRHGRESWIGGATNVTRRYFTMTF
jgi:hypothetical protein